MPSPTRKPKLQTYHRFLDEAGDTTFFGKGKVDIVGTPGVSKVFSLGMVRIKQDLGVVRNRIVELQDYIVNDAYFKTLPSVAKRVQSNGFYFHANKDFPDVRKVFFDFLRDEVSFSVEAFVGRKIPALFVGKHNSSEDEFYADLLSHLLKSKLKQDRLVINVAERGNSTRMHNLNSAVKKAEQRFLLRNSQDSKKCKISFNVQTPISEPLLAVADYALWAIQRVFETGETRFYDALFAAKKVSLVVDLYDKDKYDPAYKKWANYYSYPDNPLTSKNLVGPSSP